MLIEQANTEYTKQKRNRTKEEKDMEIRRVCVDQNKIDFDRRIVFFFIYRMK